MHLVITDSGLGGLGICAAVERNLRCAGAGAARITYVNAWPEEGRGYNSIPDEARRVAIFDRALDSMGRLRPGRIVIACNTLSILYRATAFARTAAVPVIGIIDAGAELFLEALRANPASRIVLFGTAITIHSGVHRARLIAGGIDPARIDAVSCHGLATEIERDAEGPAAGAAIEECVSRLARHADAAGPVFAGLCCTHYGYVADRFQDALERHVGGAVGVLDPNHRLASLVSAAASADATGDPGTDIPVRVVSKVVLADGTRRGIGALVSPVSPATAYALQSYAHVPDLF